MPGRISPFTVIKDAGADLDYLIDWTGWLGSDTIVTSTWSAPPASQIVVHNPSVDSSSKMALVWLKGGVAGGPFLVTNHIITAAGRQEERSLNVTIQPR